MRRCAPRQRDVYESLTKTHSGFETPCGSYAHFKLTRYLLRVTRDSRYGDSMERVMYNTILGAKPLERDGRTFIIRTTTSRQQGLFAARLACCSGTMAQVAADYRINTYFRDARGVYVNLYIRRRYDGRRRDANCVDADSAYPYDGTCSLK